MTNPTPQTPDKTTTTQKPTWKPTPTPWQKTGRNYSTTPAREVLFRAIHAANEFMLKEAMTPREVLQLRKVRAALEKLLVKTTVEA